MQRAYYAAYDDRYRQVHQQNLEWFHKTPSPIVMETIEAFSLSRHHRLLEIGCGEGRDAFPLLEEGFDLLATDVSPEAVSFCRKRMPHHAAHFQTLDCVTQQLDDSFDFIYAVAVIHMLVPDSDRNAFYSFIANHLKAEGIALICTMGDGSIERRTDISTAFQIQERVHQQTGKTVQIAGTSCRMVSFDSFREELSRNGLRIVTEGFTAAEPDFPLMMYAVVRRG